MRLKNTKNIIALISISSVLREQIKRLEEYIKSIETEKNSEPELKGRALTPSVPENGNERSDNESSDHDTSEQNQPTSTRYYRLSNSVDGEAITPSKAYRNNDYRKRSRYLHSNTPSRPLRNIDNRRERHSATIISIRSSSEKSTESSSEDSSQEKRIPKYLYSTDMPKDLYDALRREDYLMKKKSTSKQNEHNRQNIEIIAEKRKQRAKMIEKLQETKDPLMEKFSKHELRPFNIDNRYHSLENSETDQSSHPGDRIIVTKDLKWRLDTYRRFLHDHSYVPNEGTAPLNALKWLVSGYSGSLKKEVDKFIQVRSSYIGNNSIDNNDTINN
ncbi:hypothetical protein RhiirB3_426981 [Rhizophagus irregularis]|nr:hypothetical protein RhiirB3_426981 [Rhizophagus irregularis]